MSLLSLNPNLSSIHTHTNCWIQIWCPHCVTSQVVGWHWSGQCITTPLLHPNKDQGTNEQARCLSGVRGWMPPKWRQQLLIHLEVGDSQKNCACKIQGVATGYLWAMYVHIAIHQLCFGHVANCTLLHPVMTESKSPTTLKTNSSFGGAILLNFLLTSYLLSLMVQNIGTHYVTSQSKSCSNSHQGGYQVIGVSSVNSCWTGAIHPPLPMTLHVKTLAKNSVFQNSNIQLLHVKT